MAAIMDSGFRKLGKPTYNAKNIEKKTVPVPSQKPTYGIAKNKTVPKIAKTEPVNKPVTKPKRQENTSYASLSGLNADRATSPQIKTKTTEQGSANDYADEPTKPKSIKKQVNTLPHPKDVVGKWAVQIGAYSSRVKTDNALRTAKSRLPAHLQIANPMSVPLNTEQGMIFRARLGGLSEPQARQACQIFDDCIAVAPIATRLTSR